MFKSGFVNIIGNPNVGKSTLMNALVGEPLSIVTYKPQTTRHRIQGILTTEEYQIVFSDTPGYVNDPSYRLHDRMNTFVHGTFKDADVMIFMTTPHEVYPVDHPLITQLSKIEGPLILALNKIDLCSEKEVAESLVQWSKMLNCTHFYPMSALNEVHVEKLLEIIISELPAGPVYYPEDEISNRNMRFFVEEMVREQIFLQFREEIPYSTQVEVEQYKEEENLIRISAMIYVNRKTQKSILIGKGGQSIKALGIAARKRVEQFVGKQVHLELYVKVRENWRDDEKQLSRLGYRKP